MSINQRLNFLIETLKMNINSFSKLIGVNEGTTRNYIDRGSKPGSEYLEKVARSVEGLNTNWLLTGEGEPFKGEGVKPAMTIHKSGNFSESKSSGNKNNITGISTPSESSGTEIEYYRQRIKDLEDQNNKLLTQLLQLIKKE
jgi:hypothetical protein